MLNTNDLYWAAGFIEGEGSFGCVSSSFITVSQVQRAPLERLQSLFGGSIIFNKKRSIYKWTLCGSQATGLQMTLFSLMSPRRKEQIKEALRKWRQRAVCTRYRTHCPKGHEYSQENTRTYLRKDGYRARYCRRCYE